MTDFTKVQQALERRGYTVRTFAAAAEAAAYLDGAIDGKTVGFGGSATLDALGVYDKLAAHNTVIWHWKQEANAARKAAMQTQVYLSSANGLAESGEIVNIDGTGNRVSATLFGHEKVYFVIGRNKLAPTYEAAVYRARNVAAPQRARQLGKKTPCAVKADRCYDCRSPERVCRLAHGLSFRAIRNAAPEALIGIASTGKLCYPHSPADETTARQETFRLTDADWMFTHPIVLDAVCLGRVEPEPGALRGLLSAVTPAEWDTMHAVPDFIGVNSYNGSEIAAGPDGVPVYLPRPQGFACTALKWPVTPEIMAYGFAFLFDRYRLPLYVTECGLSCNDHIFLDGQVHDADRIDFLHRYLLALCRGCERADVRGFFHWSLTDNFEWHSGYAERFGLIYVDYPTQKRILKDSARWFAQTARENGRNL